MKVKFDLLFSFKWDFIEHGTAIETFKDGTTKTILYGMGPKALHYIKTGAKLELPEYYQKCSDSVFTEAWADEYTSNEQHTCRTALSKRIPFYATVLWKQRALDEIGIKCGLGIEPSRTIEYAPAFNRNSRISTHPPIGDGTLHG